MGAGKYIHQLQLQHQVITGQNAQSGAVILEWQPVTRLWAAIEYLSARDLIAAQAQESEVVARIEIPFREGVSAGMRLVKGAKVYTITGALPDKQTGRKYLTLPCSEGLLDG